MVSESFLVVSFPEAMCEGAQTGFKQQDVGKVWAISGFFLPMLSGSPCQTS